jgi:hypothetical protein
MVQTLFIEVITLARSKSLSEKDPQIVKRGLELNGKKIKVLVNGATPTVSQPLFVKELIAIKKLVSSVQNKVSSHSLTSGGRG